MSEWVSERVSEADLAMRVSAVVSVVQQNGSE